MSSHHIIREDQEPALVIDNSSFDNLDIIQQLLDWSPTVVVTERALEKVLSWGIKIDIVIALESQVEELKLTLQDQFPFRILSCNSEVESLNTAFHFLIASKQKAVNVISDSALESFERFPSIDVGVILTGKRWVFIRNGHFEKWLPAQTTISFYPKSAHPELIIEKEGIVTVHRDQSFWVCEIN